MPPEVEGGHASFYEKKEQDPTEEDVNKGEGTLGGETGVGGETGTVGESGGRRKTNRTKFNVGQNHGPIYADREMEVNCRVIEGGEKSSIKEEAGGVESVDKLILRT